MNERQNIYIYIYSEYIIYSVYNQNMVLLKSKSKEKGKKSPKKKCYSFNNLINVKNNLNILAFTEKKEKKKHKLIRIWSNIDIEIVMK